MNALDKVYEANYGMDLRVVSIQARGSWGACKLTVITKSLSIGLAPLSLTLPLSPLSSTDTGCEGDETLTMREGICKSMLRPNLYGTTSWLGGFNTESVLRWSLKTSHINTQYEAKLNSQMFSWKVCDRICSWNKSLLCSCVNGWDVSWRDSGRQDES